MKISIVKLYKFMVPILVIFGSLFSVAAGFTLPGDQISVIEEDKVLSRYQLSFPPKDEELAGNCYSLDVIFVIDQSSTMSDPNYPTDPTYQRQTAVQAMVDWLASNVLDVCPESRHQVGVISFGTKARIDLPLTGISPNSMEELLALEKRVNQDIVADDLGGTQPLEAFQQIAKMFDDSKISGGGTRKRVVIFLTDGLIGSDSFRDHPIEGFVIPAQNLADYIDKTFPFDPVLLKREQCISAQVDAYKKFENVPYDKLHNCYVENDASESAYQNSTYLYTVLMNFGQAWPSETKKIYRDVAESHAGEVMDFYDVGSENRQEIPTYFVTILSKLTGVPTGQVECGGVVVNPYLDKAIFTFYKFSPDTKVSLRYTDVNGVQHQVVGGKGDLPESFHIDDYQAYGTNERYIFKDPHPGIWFVESDRCRNGGISAFYQEKQVNAGGFTLSIPPLPQYDIPPYYDASYPTYLTYQMHNDAGEVINNSDQLLFSVNVTAAVVDPSGTPRDYILKWNSQEQIFKANTPLEIPLAGTYKVSYVGITKVHEGDLSVTSEVLSDVFDKDKILFKHENLEFTVEEVVPFSFSVEPANQQILSQIHGTILSGWPLPVMPVPVRIEVHGRVPEGDEEPEDVPTEKIILNPNKAFTVWIVSADKSVQSDPIFLEQDPGNPDLFTGEIPWNDTREQLTLHVDLSGEFAEGYGPDFRKVESTFSRQDASPFYRQEFYYFLLGALVCAILIWIAYQIWLHIDPVRGTVVIYKGNTEITRFDIYTSRKISVFKLKGQGMDLKILKIKKARVDLDSDSQPIESITVYGKTECGQNINEFVLSTGGKNSYCTRDFEYEIEYVKN